LVQPFDDMLASQEDLEDEAALLAEVLTDPNGAEPPAQADVAPVRPLNPPPPETRPMPQPVPFVTNSAPLTEAEYFGASLRALTSINTKLERLVQAEEKVAAALAIIAQQRTGPTPIQNPYPQPQMQQQHVPQLGPAIGAQGQGAMIPSGWLCPVHGQVKVVPPGVSKKPPFRAYPAFEACPAQGCAEKPPRN
jgi:hypothetical protein